MKFLLKSKLLFTIFFVLFYVSAINAQLSIGLKGGINFGNMKMSNLIPGVQTSPKSGVAIGGFIEYEFSNIFASLLEIRYVQKGIEGKINIPDYISEAKYYFNYLEFPLYFTFKIDDHALKPFLIGGINLGYLLSANVEGTTNGEKVSYDRIDEYEKVDLAVDFGIGLEYLISTDLSYLFSLNYSYGLTDILKWPDDTNYHRGILLLIGAKFKL